MTRDHAEAIHPSSQTAVPAPFAYDPFVRGPFPVGVRTIEALDRARDRLFPCEIWHPAAAQHAGQDTTLDTQDAFAVPFTDTRRRQMAVRDALVEAGTHPLILFSHSSGGDRRQSTFLCTHLASHGYVVAALDHSERVTAALARKDGETDQQREARWAAMIQSRVPDIRFLLDHLRGAASHDDIQLDPARIGIVGHSFGGWTALAAIDDDRNCDLRAVVALAPGGASQRRPGMLPVELAFAWGRDVPTLYLVAANDASLPLAGMIELFERTPAARRMVILRRADHMHFMDGVAALHEAVRTMPWSGELARIQQDMRPIAELCQEEQAHLFVRGLTLCHLDATLRQRDEAQRFWIGNVRAELAARGVDAVVHAPERERKGSPPMPPTPTAPPS